MDDIEEFLKVECNEEDEIVINVPIVFSPQRARNFAQLLLDHAASVEREINRKKEEFRIASLPTVDRTARVLTDGSPVTDDHREILPSGMQKGYVVLSAEERNKGFVRPVRRTYRHKVCHSTTTMGIALAETYARCPTFYSGTFCCHCGTHCPLDQFVWDGTNEQVGS